MAIKKLFEKNFKQLLNIQDMKRRVSQDLAAYVEAEILPRYDAFDPAHRRDHILKVIDNSLSLAEHYDVDPDMIYAIAAFHDLGVAKGRERHHIESGIIVENDPWLKSRFSPEQIHLMKEAVEDHRASNTWEPRSIYGKIVAEADRDIVPEQVIKRTIQYGKAHYPEMDRERQYERFVKHIEGKYGTGGYLHLWLPQSPNASRLAELRSIIADKDRLRELFDRYYEMS